MDLTRNIRRKNTSHWAYFFLESCKTIQGRQSISACKQPQSSMDPKVKLQKQDLRSGAKVLLTWFFRME